MAGCCPPIDLGDTSTMETIITYKLVDLDGKEHFSDKDVEKVYKEQKKLSEKGIATNVAEDYEYVEKDEEVVVDTPLDEPVEIAEPDVAEEDVEEVQEVEKPSKKKK